MSSDFRLGAPHPLPSSSGGNVLGSDGKSINELLKFKDDNVLVGLRAGLYIETFPDANDNIMIGTESGLKVEGNSSKNIFIGTSAGDNMVTGNNNMIFGANSRFNSTLCNDRILFGSNFTGLNGDFSFTLHPDYTLHSNYYASFIPSTGINKGFNMTNNSNNFSFFINSNGSNLGNSIFSINSRGLVGINTSIQNNELSIVGNMDVGSILATQDSTFSNDVFIGGTLTVTNANFSSLVLENLQVMNLTAINNNVNGVNVLDALVITQNAEIIADNVTFLDSFRNVSCNDLNANGNISFSGTNFIVTNTTCKFNTSLIQINSTASGTTVSPTMTSGFLINRGNSSNYMILYDESSRLLTAGFNGATMNPFVMSNSTRSANNIPFYMNSSVFGNTLASSDNLKFDGSNLTLNATMVVNSLRVGSGLNITGNSTFNSYQKFTLGLNTTRTISANSFYNVVWDSVVGGTTPITSYWSSSGTTISNASGSIRNWLVSCVISFGPSQNVTASTSINNISIIGGTTSFKSTLNVAPFFLAGSPITGNNPSSVHLSAVVTMNSNSSMYVSVYNGSNATITLMPTNNGVCESFISITELPL